MYHKSNGGFSLIELLTVIAIIGILAGLIFPIAGAAKKKARQTECMNNMFQIFVALKQFQLDEHRYPDFIAGPVQTTDGIPYDGSGTIQPLEKSTGVVNGEMLSLYPEYIKSVSGLNCPLSMINSSGTEFTTSSVVADPVSNFGGGGKNGIRSTSVFYLYLYSSYDYQLPKKQSSSWDGVHYSNTWLDMNLPASMSNVDVERQLRWRMPPSDTVITWCSYHRDNNANGSKDLVLWLDGHVKPVSTSLVNNATAGGWHIKP